MLCLPYYAYVFSSTKLEIRAKQVLPGSNGSGQEHGGNGQHGEMTLTIHTHVNKLL
jgi:3-oxoacyl-ACP reductase-like protein